MPYAVLFNTDQEDYPPKPQCILIDASDDETAVPAALRVLLERADAHVLTASTERIMARYTEGHKPPRVVEIRVIAELDAKTPHIEDVREALIVETEERKRVNKARLEREREEYDRRTYERLKARFEPER